MREAALWAFVIGGVIFLVIFGMTQLREAKADQINAQTALEAERNRALPMLMAAYGDLRIASAQAFTMALTAIFPWAVLAGGMFATACVFGLLIVTLFLNSQNQTGTREIVYLPNPNLPRHETWQALASGDTGKEIIISRKEKNYS